MAHKQKVYSVVKKLQALCSLLMSYHGTDAMRYAAVRLIAVLALIPLVTGCTRLALQFSPSFIPNITRSFFEECDPELAKQSLPAELKLLEGLLKEDPHNRSILTTLCMGFTGYALLFVEEDDPVRASRFYLRARNYGFEALGQKAMCLREKGLKKDALSRRLAVIKKGDHKALFWTALSWNAWINLNLDQPRALAQLGAAEACVDRILQVAPDYFYGAPYILKGWALAARPPSLGGDIKGAHEYFTKAMHSGHGTFYLAHVSFARYYAVRTQNKTLFSALLKEVISSPPDAIKGACLINAVMGQRAQRLLEMSEDFFL